MASSSSERVPITPPAETTLAITPDSRVLENPSSEEALCKQLKEAGLDDEQRDNLIAYVAKPESEVRGSWTPKQIKNASAHFPFNLGHPAVGGGKKAKTAQQEAGSVELPRIHHDVQAEMDETDIISSTKPSFFNFSKGGYPCLLWDVREKRPNAELVSKNWKVSNHGGPVRNQGDHDNCWTYSSTDVYSSHRLKNKEDKKFRVMSARYLTFYVSEAQRNRPREEEDRDDHKCHGFPVLAGLKFIKEHGVPEEDPLDATRDYSCVENPPSRNQQLFHFGPDIKFLESDKIEDLHQMLLHQAVSADMIVYEPEYKNTNTLNVVYEGPTSEGSRYVGWHAVLILSIVFINGKWVALVKTSHGIKTCAGGYLYVSLSKMFLQVKYTPRTNLIGHLKTRDLTLDDEAITTPSYLLRKFTGVKYGATNQKSVAVAGTSQEGKRKRD